MSLRLTSPYFTSWGTQSPNAPTPLHRHGTTTCALRISLCACARTCLLKDGWTRLALCLTPRAGWSEVGLALSCSPTAGTTRLCLVVKVNAPYNAREADPLRKSHKTRTGHAGGAGRAPRRQRSGAVRTINSGGNYGRILLHRGALTIVPSVFSMRPPVGCPLARRLIAAE